MKKCVICHGSSFSEYRGRPEAKCNTCGAFERTRMLALHFQSVGVPKGARVLHIAPEESLFNFLRTNRRIAEYVVADFQPENYSFTRCVKIDLCDLKNWESERFDIILHSHVLEHTLCNIAYTLFHIHRMLARDGRHIFVVPFSPGRFEESFFKLSAEEASRRFGQWDHVRRFGKDDVRDHLGRIVRLPSEFDAKLMYGETALRLSAIPESHWRGLNGSTVIDIGKDEFLLK